ncbi:MAG: RNA polymerase factor sigma-54 [Akkermansia sp.]|nr:RNA polymerase factor sigma-54 [Akkermansia sp.]MBR2313834.1 RNA polymerase factor sigma-54 [Akkermansia sp.]
MSNAGMQHGMKQSMVASAGMQQFMRALQATNMELRTLATQAMAANPALEELPPPDEDERELSIPDTDSARRHDYLLDTLTESPSLRAHLEEQILRSALPAKVEQAALELVQHLDARGYFSEAPGDIAREKGWNRNQLSRALQAVQDLDPAGVGASDLRESLMLQLRREGEANSLAMQLLQNHWQQLVQHRYAEAAREQGESELAVTGAAHRIARLNPDPGAAFTREVNSVIEPDVVVLSKGNELEVVLTNTNVPRLALSAEYREMMAEQADKPEVRRYLSRCFSEGRKLIKAIADRQTTILQVAEQIVQRQKAFFLKGPAALAPLRMEQVAEAAGLHVSTISRAVNGKFLKCSWGTFELRHFFTSALHAGKRTTVSPEAVQARIRELIASENPRKPLSDARLEQMLAEDGICVARRTIAKYRDILRILPASMRKA